MWTLLHACLFMLVLHGARMDYDFLNKSWNGKFCTLPYIPTSCNCDHECAQYGDCCHDSKFFRSEQQTWGVSPFSCKFLGTHSLYVIASCPEETSEQKDCQNLKNNFPDPLLDVPVTSSRTNRTYQNAHCAICNGDFDVDDDILWDIKFSCGGKKAISSVLRREFNKLHSMTVQEMDAVQERDFVHLSLECIEYNEYSLVWELNFGCLYSLFETLHGLQNHNLKPGNISNIICKVDLQSPKELQDRKRLCYPDLVGECPQDWGDKEVQEKCQAYQDLIIRKSTGTVYRNPFCSYCWAEAVTEEESYTVIFPTLPGLENDYIDYKGEGKEVEEDKDKEEEEEQQQQQQKQDYDTTELYSRKPLRPTLHDETRTATPVMRYTTEATVSHNTSLRTIITTKVSLHYLDQEYYNETYKHIEIALPRPAIHRHERIDESFAVLLKPRGTGNSKCKPGERFEKLRRKCYTVPKSTKDFTTPNDVEVFNETNIITENIINTKIPSKNKKILSYMTNIGVSISIICLLLHLSVFIATPRLRNLPAMNTASLSISLLLLYVCYIIRKFVELPCLIQAVIMHYTLLSTFTWTLITAFDVWTTIRKSITKLEFHPGNRMKRFIIYSLIAWILPSFIVAVPMIIHMVEIESEFEPGYEDDCWFNNDKALLVFVVAPLCIVMFFNIFFFSWSAWLIYSSRLGNRSSVYTEFMLFVRLSLIMGLTWILGLLGNFLDHEALWYIFVILNTLQGFFIFIAFSCTKKFRAELSKHLSESVSTKQITRL